MARFDEDETQTEADPDESPPPHWSNEAEFSVFRFATWSFFHLHTLEQRLSTPETVEALRVAKLAFHFVMDTGEDHGFAAYRRTLLDARRASPSHSFSNRAQADVWLSEQPEPPLPEVIAIGGEPYSVGYNRLHRQRVLIRLPTDRELKPGANSDSSGGR